MWIGGRASNQSRRTGIITSSIRLPVTHHIGESQPKCPSEVNSVAVAMMVNIDSFREMFSE
jgi:hypothetical protein